MKTYGATCFKSEGGRFLAKEFTVNPDGTTTGFSIVECEVIRKYQTARTVLIKRPLNATIISYGLSGQYVEWESEIKIVQVNHISGMKSVPAYSPDGNNYWLIFMERL